MSTSRDLLLLTNEGVRQYTAVMTARPTGLREVGVGLQRVLNQYSTLAPGNGARIPEAFFSATRRIDAGRALVNTPGLGAYLDQNNLRDSANFWDCLAAQWMVNAIVDDDQKSLGEWKKLPTDSSRWCFDESYTHYYRHQLAAAFNVCERIDDDSVAGVVLNGAVWEHGEVAEQLLSRQFIWAHREVLVVARDVLAQVTTDPTTGKDTWKLRREASGKGRGSARHFASVLDQLSVLYDVESMGAAAIKSVMPSDFPGCGTTSRFTHP